MSLKLTNDDLLHHEGLDRLSVILGHLENDLLCHPGLTVKAKKQVSAALEHLYRGYHYQGTFDE